MCVDDPAADVESEACPVADVLRRVEGLEDPGLDVVGDPGAIVGDLDGDGVRVVARPDRDNPVAVDGVDCVVDQVCPDLVELGA